MSKWRENIQNDAKWHKGKKWNNNYVKLNAGKIYKMSLRVQKWCKMTQRWKMKWIIMHRKMTEKYTKWCKQKENDAKA